MQRIIFYIGISILFVVVTGANAQQDAQFSYYMKNQLFYNPAFAGTEGVTKLSLLHRTQWAAYPDGGAPRTQVFSMSTPIYRLSSGFGVHVVNDHLGPQNNLEVQLSYAYHLGLKDAKLSFGVRGGLFSQSIDKNEYEALHPDDPVLDGGESQMRPDMAVGIYYRSEKYYAGLSVNHLLKSEFDFGVDIVKNALENHGYLMFGYIHEVNFDLKLSPSFLVQTDFNSYSFIVGGMAYYRDQLWGGLSYRQSEDINVLLGYNFLKDKSLGFGYSFGYVIEDQDAKQPTTHEAVLSYQLPVNPGSGKKVIRTPRFRH